MSLVSLFIQKKSSIGLVTFDALVSESVTADAEITTNPVEQGVDVSDNIVLQPLTFKLEAIISDTPLSYTETFNKINDFVKGSEHEKPSVKAWNELLKLQADRKPFTYQNNLKKYDNVVIKSLNYTQDKDTFNILSFSATLQEVPTVASQAVSVEQFKDKKVADKSTQTKDRGLIWLHSQTTAHKSLARL